MSNYHITFLWDSGLSKITENLKLFFGMDTLASAKKKLFGMSQKIEDCVNSYNYARVCSYVSLGIFWRQMSQCCCWILLNARTMVLILFLRYCPLESVLEESTLACVHWEFMSTTKRPWEVCRIPILTNGNSS